ncbi:choline-sulfatase [Piscinibacter sakaiensis]|uniref:Choline-sulfatase n=1 Tax=Piscinibacter sakaiensis TaxID=1547922 RepID=A0A0K8NTI8_PISS1|nr:choline-sulfatase [Piscinibacter sakaiensis]GAP33658.1 choline-sulfatase [Piscinibacter sakaiensis]
MRRPNILVFMADQMSALALREYGNATTLAPNLSRLAARGVLFRNAYTNYPICAPSRYTMLTGRLPHLIDAFDNAAELPASVPTVMHYLRRLGYRTTLSGKMHFVGPDQLHGYQERLTTDIYPADFAWVPDWRAGPRNAPTGINMRAVVEAGWCERSMQIDYDEEVAFHARQKLWDLARQAKDQPFFLTVSLTHPHTPFTASKAHWDRYDHARIDLPRVGPIPVEQLDVHSRWLYYSHGRDRMEVTEAHTRNARHAYYAMCSYIDDKLGETMEVLERSGLLDDTIVVFTADHGDMMGERGMWFKQTFFENSTRVPLIMAGPGLGRGREVEANVSLVDLLPTLLSVADDGRVELSTPVEGADLTRLAAGDGRGWNGRVHSEYYDMGVCAPCRMVREGDHKYIYTHGHPALLFDLASDPAECRNLAGDPALADVERRLHAAVLDGWQPEAMTERILHSQAARQLIWGVSRADAARDNWSIEARNGDKRRWVRGGGDQEGTNAVKGRMRFPYVPPTPQADPKPIPDVPGLAR